LSLLECPVCGETIRGRNINCCANGHLLCNTCRLRVKICPLCRDPNLAPSALATRLANVTLGSIVFKCQFERFGCLISGVPDTLATHEERCNCRVVTCPGAMRGSCHWVGSLTQFWEHVSEEDCTSLLAGIPNQRGEIVFASAVEDFLGEGTALRNSKTTYWRPCLMANHPLLDTFIFMTVMRTASGLCKTIFRASPSPNTESGAAPM